MASRQVISLFAFRPAQAAQVAAPVMSAVLTLLAVVLLWRRAAGALCEPLTPAGMLAAGATLAVLAALVRLAWRASNLIDNQLAKRRPVVGVLGDGILSVLLAISAASISLPGSTTGGLLLLWGSVLVGECIGWTLGRIGWPARRNNGSPPSARLHTSASVAAGNGLCNETAVAASQQVVQHMVRTRSADGRETVGGWLRLDFAAGQRTAVAHLAFCPPLEGSPTLTVRQRSGPDCRVKNAHVLPYGARVELRLVREPEQGQQVMLEFEAHN